MDHKTVEEYALSMPNTKLDYPFGEEVAVYKAFIPSKTPIASGSAGGLGSAPRGEWKMFALIQEGKDPVRISLKCDPQLAELLRNKYDTVMPGYHLNKKHWNTIVLTGELDEEETRALIRHSYSLVTGDKASTPNFD